MNVNKEMVERMAYHARLTLSPGEKQDITSYMEEIISMIDKIHQLDTYDIEPMGHVRLSSNILREDRVKKSLDREKVLSNAPTKKNGYFIIPKVMD